MQGQVWLPLLLAAAGVKQSCASRSNKLTENESKQRTFLFSSNRDKTGPNIAKLRRKLTVDGEKTSEAVTETDLIIIEDKLEVTEEQKILKMKS